MCRQDLLILCTVLEYWRLNLYATEIKITHHYANIPMQYAAIFKGCKNDKF